MRESPGEGGGVGWMEESGFKSRHAIDIVNGSRCTLCNLSALALGLALHIFATEC